MSALAGRLRRRLTITRSTGARDAIGGDADVLETIGVVWAEVRPRGGQALFEGEARSALPLWAVTMRPFDVRVGDWLGISPTGAIVRSVIADPATPDRIEVIAEENR